MKPTPDDIQRAHNILNAFVNGTVEMKWPTSTARECAASVSDCLCWILGHPGGQTFQMNLDNLVETARNLGYVTTPGPEEARWN